MIRKLAAAALVAATLVPVSTSVAYAEEKAVTECDGDIVYGEDIDSTSNEFIAWGPRCVVPGTGELTEGQTTGPGYITDRVCDEWRKIFNGYAQECVKSRTIVYRYEKSVTAEDDTTGGLQTKFYGLREVS